VDVHRGRDRGDSPVGLAEPAGARPDARHRVGLADPQVRRPVQLDRAPVVRRRLLGPAEAAEHAAEVAVRVGPLGGQAQPGQQVTGALQLGQGGRAVAEMKARAGQDAVHARLPVLVASGPGGLQGRPGGGRPVVPQAAALVEGRHDVGELPGVADQPLAGRVPDRGLDHPVLGGEPGQRAGRRGPLPAG
jgi:hypothetical protein